MGRRPQAAYLCRFAALEHRMKSPFWLDWRLWLALCLLSAGAVLLLTGPPVLTAECVIASLSGMPIRMRIVQPITLGPSHPAMILVAPYCLPPDSMDVMATELARRGIVCAMPDFYGRTAAESRQHMGSNSLAIMTKDVLSIVATLGKMPGVDPRRIGVSGVSIGGTVAFIAGCRNDHIAAVVPIGMKTDVYPEMPQNLLLISGLYDEFRSPTTLKHALGEYGVAKTPRINTLYGSMADGSARKVAIVPTCDHFTAPSDPLLIRELARWCEASLGAPVSSAGTMREVWRTIASGICVLAATILVAMGLVPILPRSVQRLAAHVPAWLAIRLTWPPLLCCVGVCWAAGTFIAPLRTLSADLMIALPLAYCAACYVAGHRLRTGTFPHPRAFRIAVFTALAAWIAIMLSWGIMSIPSYCQWPLTLAWYPAFVAMTTALIPCKLLLLARSFLFSEYHNTLVPAWPWYAIVISLALAPGWCGRMVHATARGMEAALDSGALSRIRVGASRSTLALLAIIIVALVMVLVRRHAEGMITRQTLTMASVVMLRFTILPFLITWCIMRSRFFSQTTNVNQPTSNVK